MRFGQAPKRSCLDRPWPHGGYRDLLCSLKPRLGLSGSVWLFCRGFKLEASGVPLRHQAFEHPVQHNGRLVLSDLGPLKALGEEKDQGTGTIDMESVLQRPGHESCGRDPA